ncbi:hypothetical protein [Amycolatopsis magusensis]|uniref:hypothetical protein n=1 Tax=Amycolatopsis magusensis TaxID=882444 RepID=UPI0024A9C21E|nr:hypothetical protein [Amycolatopsis magusensis]MDI5978489.1 hypothetical protein [Amycolatopsis magusensis]
MTKTTIGIRKTILYTVSGGFISVVFGVLGATAAQAGPRVPADAGGDGGAPAAAGPPGGAPQQQQKELSQLKTKANVPAAQAKKSAPAVNHDNRGGWAGGSPEPPRTNDKKPDPKEEQRAQSKTDKAEQDEKNAKVKAGEEERARSKADRRDARQLTPDYSEYGKKEAERKEAERAEQDARNARAKAREERKQAKAERRDARKRKATSVSPKSGPRANEVSEEIDQTAGPARIRADELARQRDEGPRGSVRAWEATANLAAEAEADAQWRERLRDVGKPKPAPKTIELDEPISGPRALEVKDEIDRTAEPVAKHAKAIKEHADTLPDGPAKDDMVKTAKAAERDARRLEFLRDAGMPALGKGLRDTVDSVVEDVQTGTKEAASLGGIATDVLVGRKNSRLVEEINTSQDETTRAFRDYVTASKARNADGSVSPAQAELVRQRLAEATAAAERHQQVVGPVQRAGKLLKAAGKLGETAWGGAGIYLDIEEGKTTGEIVSGAIGGTVGSALGKRAGIPGVWAGGFVGSALGENLFKGVRDHDKDINEYVNED